MGEGVSSRHPVLMIWPGHPGLLVGDAFLRRLLAVLRLCLRVGV